MILRYVYLFYDTCVTLSIGVLSWASCVHGLHARAVEGNSDTCCHHIVVLN